MNRRETIKNLGAGSLLITVGGFSFYRCTDDVYVPHFFEQKEYDFLSAFAECLLPTSEDSPGATEVGVASFLDQYVPACYPPKQQQMLKSTLQSLMKIYLEDGGQTLAKESVDKKNDLMELIESSKIEGYKPLKSAVLFAYFTSQEGMTKALRYDPVPGEYKGDIPLGENDKAWAI